MRRDKEASEAVATVVMDYCFMGTEHDDESVLPILAARDYGTGVLHGTVVPRKGADPWVVKDMCTFLRPAGVQEGHLEE